MMMTTTTVMLIVLTMMMMKIVLEGAFFIQPADPLITIDSETV